MSRRARVREGEREIVAMVGRTLATGGSSAQRVLSSRYCIRKTMMSILHHATEYSLLVLHYASRVHE